MALQPGSSSYMLLSILFIVGACVIAFNRRYRSPISDIPGPFLATIFILWEVWNVIEGHIEEKVIALHEKFGTSSKPKGNSSADQVRA